MTRSQDLSTALRSEQMAQLEAAIAAHDALRPTLGDDAVDATLAQLRKQLTALRRQVSPSDDQSGIAVQLNQLSEADLIRLFATEPDLAYIFKHALTQEA